MHDVLKARKPYDDWKATWKPPTPRPMALPGKVIVEFSPHAHHGEIWTPERESNNAKVVFDGHEHPTRTSRYGYLPCGTEIAYTGIDGTYFEYEGRRLCVIPKDDIELLVED